MSNCPKCNTKLSPFYLNQNCPKCNTNLVYYDLENRLQADHEKAMKEQAAVDRILNNIKASAFGGVLQIIRFVLMFSPLAWMCLPMFYANDSESVTLIGVIMEIINGSLNLGNSTYLFPIITMVCIIVFSLAVIISSLFSLGEKALKRNLIFSIINTSALTACIILAMTNGAKLGIGVLIVIITYILEFVMHILVNKKLNG